MDRLRVSPDSPQNFCSIDLALRVAFLPGRLQSPLDRLALGRLTALLQRRVRPGRFRLFRACERGCRSAAWPAAIS
jgi:hypothetical protein